MQSPNYIIVGQGIAGTCMAFNFIKLKVPFLIFDNHQKGASEVAAGLINPVVFKRLTKSWMVDQALPFAVDFYQEIATYLNQELISEMDVLRLFSSIQEQNQWASKTGSDGVGSYLKDHNRELPTGLNPTEFGAGIVSNAYWLDIQKMIVTLKKRLQSLNCMQQKNFDYSAITYLNNELFYKQLPVKGIIFCDGCNVRQNPYFNWVPLVPAKGEMLHIKAPMLNTEHVINKGFFILPRGNGLFTVGATYDWSDLSNTPTQKGKMDLEKKLNKTLSVPFEVVNHVAGIRPAAKDRRPLVGEHYNKKGLYMLNGLGTKGALLAPYCASQLTQKIHNELSLNAEIDVQRFKN